MESSRLWRAKAKVVTVVVGALGVISKSLKSQIESELYRSLQFLERRPV